MPRDRLEGCLLKFGRSYQQFQALDGQIAHFLKGKPYTVVREFDPNTREATYRLRIRERCPLVWSVMIGEIVYNLRSALDHALWQLVIEDGGQPTDHNGFPIFLDPAKYQNARGAPRLLDGLKPTSRTVIDNLQPFNTGEHAASPLWHLHELSNFDKHRALHLTGATLKGGQTRLGFIALNRPFYFRSPGIFEDGALLAQFPVAANAEISDDVDVDDRYSFGIAFDEGTPLEGSLVAPTLYKCGIRTREAISFIGDLFSAT
jgi:hypothetical protein